MTSVLQQLSAWSARLFTRPTSSCPRCGAVMREHVGWAGNLMVCSSCGREEISD